MITRQEPLCVPLSDSFMTLSITSARLEGHCLLPSLEFWQIRASASPPWAGEAPPSTEETRCHAHRLLGYDITLKSSHCRLCSLLWALSRTSPPFLSFVAHFHVKLLDPILNERLGQKVTGCKVTGVKANFFKVTFVCSCWNFKNCQERKEL